MYCPRCGIENLGEASFCRACGADISLVPQALTGRLPVAAATGGKPEKAAKVPTPEQFMSNIFIGVGFLLWFIGGALFFTRLFPFWFWAVFPAFACLGSGVGQYLSYRKEERRQELAQSHHAALTPLRPSRLAGTSAAALTTEAARDTSEIVDTFTRAPASVTEGTTRLLDNAPARRSAERE